MKRQIQSLVAIFFSILAGAIVSIAISGCQPPPAAPGPKPVRSSSNVTDGASTKPAVKPSTEKPATDPAVNKATTDKPMPDKPATDKPTTNKPGTEKPTASTTDAKVPSENPVLKKGDWNQWGGSSIRNNVPVVDADQVPLEWEPGEFDRKTGVWKPAKSKNISWVANLGSETYGGIVVADHKVFIGTNNGYGYLKRYPHDVDLGCLVCLDEKTGDFRWQHSSEKLTTGRVNDWPLMGICSTSLVEGDRLWFVTSRGEVKCLDTEGYYDDEDDGPIKNELAKLFELARAEEADQDKVGPAVKELDEGKLPESLRKNFADAGFELPPEVTVSAKEAGKSWNLKATVGGNEREVRIVLQGPKLIASKVVTTADKDEADVVWSLDMMKQLGVSQHNMASCSVTTWGDLLMVCTSNGVSDDHKVIPAPEAPSFICLNKHTGEIYWTDNSPGANILHGQWSSPTVAIIKDVPQVIFCGGDGWVYSFKADTGHDGKPELLWKFDINEKDAKLILGEEGTKNDVIATPVVYDDKVYFATGQDPEHGTGPGTFWCIDPTKRGDISESLVFNIADPDKPVPVKRVQSAVEAEGDRIKPNENSGVVWKFSTQDWNNDGKVDSFNETFHRSIGTAAIKNDLLFVADGGGMFFCINAKSGKVNWGYDTLAECWGSPLIADDKVFIGDGDGDIAIFNLSADPKEAMQVAEVDGETKYYPINAKKSDDDGEPEVVNMGSSVFSTPIFADGVLYISTRNSLFAIEKGATPSTAAKDTTAGN